MGVVDEELPTFWWKQTLLSRTTHEIEMTETHDRKQTHKAYSTQIIFPTLPYQTVMGRLYNWHTATKPSLATG